MANFVKGNELMLFDGQGKSFAFATSHTLTLSADSSDIASKDHGIWGASEITKLSWEITSENLFTVDDFDKMFTAWTGATEIDVIFGIKAQTDNTKTVVDGDYDNWTPNTTSKVYYGGKAVITSLTANANNGDNATYSVTLAGRGKFAKVSTTSTGDGE